MHFTHTFDAYVVKFDNGGYAEFIGDIIVFGSEEEADEWAKKSNRSYTVEKTRVTMSQAWRRFKI